MSSPKRSNVVSRLLSTLSRIRRYTTLPTEEVPSANQEPRIESKHGKILEQLMIIPEQSNRGEMTAEMISLREEMSLAMDLFLYIAARKDLATLKKRNWKKQIETYSRTHWIQTFRSMILEDNLPTENHLLKLYVAKVISYKEMELGREMMHLIQVSCPSYGRALYLKMEHLRNLNLSPNL
ncbi:accessory protein [Ninorex virus]|nr:accessory protein [Ninorex virus]